MFISLSLLTALVKVVDVLMENPVQLRPFFWLGQLIGFIPCQIQMNCQSVTFSFSFCHPLTLWYILVLIFMMISGWLTAIDTLNVEFHTNFDKTEVDNGGYKGYLCWVVNWLCETIVFFSAQLIWFRYSRLEKALKLVEKFDRSLPPTSNSPVDKGRLVHRASIAAVWILNLVESSFIFKIVSFA